MGWLSKAWSWAQLWDLQCPNTVQQYTGHVFYALIKLDFFNLCHFSTSFSCRFEMQSTKWCRSWCVHVLQSWEKRFSLFCQLVTISGDISATLYNPADTFFFKYSNLETLLAEDDSTCVASSVLRIWKCLNLFLKNSQIKKKKILKNITRIASASDKSVWN